MKKILFVLLSVTVTAVNAQTSLIMIGQTYTNSDNHWAGVFITRDEPTTFIYKNNSITSVNESGYMLQCGDDWDGVNKNHVDGAVITGNKFIWNGTEPLSLTHGMISGYNINYVIKYNCMENVPYGIVIKSGVAGDNMTYTAGGLGYNIFKNSKNAIIVKGMNGVCIYNNTFYNDQWNPIVITNNEDSHTGSPCLNIKIKNNIFYSKYNIAPIRIHDSISLATFECDYNVYYREDGDHTPTFTVRSTNYTWTEWKALGFDTHSMIIDPSFKDTINLVPSIGLEYGTDLGLNWKDGLSIDAIWGINDPEITPQGTIWQVGARIAVGDETDVPINKSGEAIPKQITLDQNYPNPFNPNTVISYQLPGVGTQYIVSLKIYDVLGRETALLVNEKQNAGTHQIQWNAKGMASGIYIYRLNAGSFSAVKKLMLLK
jgi:hypothetical protein